MQAAKTIIKSFTLSSQPRNMYHALVSERLRYLEGDQVCNLVVFASHVAKFNIAPILVVHSRPTPHPVERQSTTPAQDQNANELLACGKCTAVAAQRQIRSDDPVHARIKCQAAYTCSEIARVQSHDQVKRAHWRTHVEERIDGLIAYIGATDQ